MSSLVHAHIPASPPSGALVLSHVPATALDPARPYRLTVRQERGFTAIIWLGPQELEALAVDAIAHINGEALLIDAIAHLNGG